MSVRRKIIAALLAGVMVLLVGILSFVTVRQFARATRGVDRTVEVILRIESVISMLKDAESAQRGYLITSDSAYLRSGAGRDSIPLQLAALRQLNADNQVRLARLDSLSDVVAAKLRELDEVIVTRERVGLPAALALVRTDRGMRLMADARRIAVAIEDQERQILRAQEQERRRAGTAALWIIALGSISAMVLIVAINRSIRDDVDAFAKVVRDATEAREEAERAKSLALSASQAKSDFLATMSHEIRTPINAVLGYSELLALGLAGPLTEEQRRQLDRITSSTRHLLGLVNEVLDLAKVESGTMRVEVGVAEAGETVDAAIALVRPQAASRGIIVSDKCDGHRTARYVGDEPRVRQVITNLLVNAVKFTDAGGSVSVNCEIDATPDEGSGLGQQKYIAIRVSDTGIGIPATQQHLIFQPFVQAGGESRTAYARQRSGAGLGLAISRQLAQLMGGDITVRSEVGAGSTFTLWLPAAEREATGATLEVKPAPLATPREVLAVSALAPALDSATQDYVVVGSRLLWDVGAIVDAWRIAMRQDDAVPTPDVQQVELDDHTATLVTDIALAMRFLGTPEIDRSGSLRDSSAILRIVAEQHGRQRFSLGWAESAIEREMAHLAAAIDKVIITLRNDISPTTMHGARAAAQQFVDQALRLSLGAYRLASQQQQRAS